jgi:uncharacterized protein (TIGR02996 family)
MSEAGLLSALREDPDDEASRLIAADWQEDHGDPARAELLRLQVELDRWVPELERREALQNRRAELLARHAPHWLGPLHTAAQRWDYAGGLFNVTLKAATLLGRRMKDAPELFERAWVGSLRLVLDTPKKTIPRLITSPRLTGLVALDLSGNNLTDADLGGWLESSRLAMVRRLNLSNNKLTTDTLVRLERSGCLRQLVALDLRNNLLPAGALEFLLRQAETPYLRELDVQGNGLEGRDLIAVAEWCQKRGARCWQGKVPQRRINALGMEFVRIPPGKFRMGSAETEGDHRDHEGPIHPVRLTRPFYLARFLTTKQQFYQITGDAPSYFGQPGLLDHDLPVDSVSYAAALAFCERLAALPGEREQGHRYRLPTEAEWEYACRAGSTSPYWWGDIGSANEGNFDGTRPYNTRSLSPYLQRTTRVGSYPPNPFGLYDTHGNLWEWCADYYTSSYYRESPAEDPPGATEVGRRVLRGGSWHSDAPWCRSAYRCSDVESSSQNWYGFRVVLETRD